MQIRIRHANRAHIQPDLTSKHEIIFLFRSARTSQSQLWFMTNLRILKCAAGILWMSYNVRHSSRTHQICQLIDDYKRYRLVGGFRTNSLNFMLKSKNAKTLINRESQELFLAPSYIHMLLTTQYCFLIFFSFDVCICSRQSMCACVL